MTKQPGVVLYWEDMDSLCEMPQEMAVEMLRAIRDYAREGVEPELSGACAMIWPYMRRNLERDRARYAEIVEKRRKAGKISGEKRRQRTAASVDSVEQNEPTSASASASTSTSSSSSSSASVPASAPTPTSAERDGRADDIRPYGQERVAADGQTDGQAGEKDGFEGGEGAAPSRAQAEAYGRKKGISAREVERFLDYYGQRHWRIEGKPVRSWRKLMDRWAQTAPVSSPEQPARASPGAKENARWVREFLAAENQADAGGRLPPLRR